jgi:hypothetical protein
MNHKSEEIPVLKARFFLSRDEDFSCTLDVLLEARG